MGKIGVYSRIFTLLRFLAETTETEKKNKKKNRHVYLLLVLAHLQVVWSVKGGHYPAGSLPGKINSQTERTSVLTTGQFGPLSLLLNILLKLKH
jgi:hypothetical protein